MHIWQYYVSMPRVLATILLRGTIPVKIIIHYYYFEWREIQMNKKGKMGVDELFA